MPGAGSLMFPVVALIAWVMVVVKYRHVRRDRGDPTQAALLAVFVFLALAFTTGSPHVWSLINGYSRYGDLATLYAQTFVVCAMAALLVLLILWSYPPQRARPQIYLRLALVFLALTVMATLFGTVDRTHSRDATRLARWYAASPGYTAYLLVYQAVFAATMLDIIVLCARYARRVRTPAVRRGLITTAVGAGLGLLYSLVRLSDIVAAQYAISLDALEPVAELSAAVGAVLVMLGLTLPSWAARYGAARTHLAQRHAYRQMQPLWSALVSAVPGITLEDLAKSPASASSRAFDFRLRRRVIEIHDGMLALRLYRGAEAAEQARRLCEQRNLTGIARAAMIEAACLHAALAAKAAGRKQDGTTTPDHTFAGSSLQDELRWLAHVSRAFATLRATGCATPAPAAPEARR